jgi:Na+:H+ antiporter, NhaA family
MLCPARGRPTMGAFPHPAAFPMTPVTPFLRRSALALLSGAGLATLCVNIAPGFYHDLRDWRLMDLPGPGGPLFIWPAATPLALVTDLLMAIVLFLMAKELWEAVTHQRGPFAGRRALAPLALAAGGMAGAALVWIALTGAIETAEEAAGAPGWLVPMGGSAILAYAFGRWALGMGHAALQVLLFVTLCADIAALLLAGIVAPGAAGLRPLWLILPLGAALAGWAVMTRPLSRPGLTERERRRDERLWPWAVVGAVSWLGVAASGLPPALGLLPLIPAIPQSRNAFGLFATAEGFLHDPLNRMAHLLMTPALGVLFLFGFLQGALDLQAVAPTTWVALGALALGKPAGIMAVALVLARAGRLMIEFEKCQQVLLDRHAAQGHPRPGLVPHRTWAIRWASLPPTARARPRSST